MLKKTIGILCPSCPPFDHNSLLKGLGGTETWILNMSLQFQRNGYHVIIFNRNNYTYNHPSGVQIYPISFFLSMAEYQYFEHIFILREFNMDIVNYIKNTGCCQNIYYVLHDIRLWKTGHPAIIDIETEFTIYDRDITDTWAKEHIKKFFFMSSWHYNFNKNYFPEDKVAIIGNGINFETYEEQERDNSILWSSCFDRGLDILIEKLYPKIVQKIPDFKIYVASYDNKLDDKYKNLDYVINLGSLNKEDLYMEMRKHKAWFFPLTHWETFCITVLENIANDVNIVCPCKFGVYDTLKYFKFFCIQDDSYDNEEYCQYVANIITDKILQYEKYKPIRDMLKFYCQDNYTWEHIYNKLHNIIKDYETNNSNNN